MRTVSVSSKKPQPPMESSPLQTFHRMTGITRTTKTETKTLRAFSNSRLEGVSECPIFGIVHMQRQYPQRGRALALEAGEAMHQFFAAMRCWQLHYVDKLPDHATSAGMRIFGEARWRDIWKKVRKETTEINQVGTLAVEILNSSGYYDDPN